MGSAVLRPPSGQRALVALLGNVVVLKVIAVPQMLSVRPTINVSLHLENVIQQVQTENVAPHLPPGQHAPVALLESAAV